jgi:hypothetical protein
VCSFRFHPVDFDLFIMIAEKNLHDDLESGVPDTSPVRDF